MALMHALPYPPNPGWAYMPLVPGLRTTFGFGLRITFSSAFIVLLSIYATAEITGTIYVHRITFPSVTEMCCNFCQGVVIRDPCPWMHYPEHVEPVDNSSLPPQPQQYYDPPAPTNSGGDYTSMVPPYHPTRGGDSTGDDDVPAATHLYHLGFPQSNGQFPSDLTPPFPGNDQYVYVATGQPPYNHDSPLSNNPPANDLGFPENASESNPNEGHPHSDDNHSESHASGSLVCKWRVDHGLCGKTVNKKAFAKHVASHLPPPGPTLVICRWDGCQLEGNIRRDTIIRHIRQIDCKIRPRRQS